MTTRSIPETGQEQEVVRMHPISWDASVMYILELQQTLATRTLIINDLFSLPANLLVDAMIQWVRHYMISAHFNHYVRIGYALGNYSPAKGRAMLFEEVPEVFVHIARHLSRPRLLIDGSPSLPIPDAPICDGVRYNGLQAVQDADIVRNGVTAGAPLAVLHAIVIAGTPIDFRPRIYSALRRNFSGLPLYKSAGPEGLVPARMCYWSTARQQFIHYLELTDSYDKAIFDIDVVLSPLIIDLPAFVALPPPPPANAPVANAAVQLVAYNAMTAHFASVIPPTLQWMAHDHLTGVQGSFTRDIFLERERSGYHVNPVRTAAFSLAEHLSQIGDALDAYNFPPIGVVPQITSLRTLANDLGIGHPTSRGRNNRRDQDRSTKRATRTEKAAKRDLSRKFRVEDQSDNGAAVDEKVDSTEDPSDQDSLHKNSTAAASSSRFNRSRRKKKEGKA